MIPQGDRTRVTFRSDGPIPHRLEEGSSLRFVVEESSGREFSLSRGYLPFVVGEYLGEGGQGRVLAVDLAAEPTEPDSGVPHAADGADATHAADADSEPEPAAQPSSPRRYALKEYASREAASAEWEMLYAHRDERTIPHPHVYGFFQTGKEGAWHPERHWGVVMELISGEALSALLANEDRRMRLAAEDALVITAPVMEWLSHSCRNSRRRDVHRDIKPQNIILEKGGATRLIDFGIASNASLARVQRGTSGYAAPELYAQDEHADLNDPRVDTYGMAATLYALLCQGEPPAYGTTVEQVQENRLRHGEHLTKDLMERLKERLADVFGTTLPDSGLHHAVESTIREEDLRILGIVAQGLEADQSRRPDPAELESLLRAYTSPSAYADAVFGRAIARALQISQRKEGTGDAPEEGENDDRGFVVALDAFNRGMYDEALPILRKQSDLKNTSAMYYYGVCVRDGLGNVERSYEQAAALFSEAALQGNLLAQNALGHLLLEGAGVPQNTDKAIEWLRKSARNDDATGQVGFRPAQEWLDAHGIDY